MSKNLALSKIRLDGGTQPRSVLNFETIDEYADLMKAGAKFPTVVVFYDGDSYWLADGFHRVKAAWQCNLGGIDAEIIQGTLEEAKWYSFGVNKSHGLRRTNEDKQRCVKAALEHSRSQGLSDREIAKHVGVHHDTVGEWRKKLDSSVGNRQIETRTVTRGGVKYQQDVTNIGHRGVAERSAQLAPQSHPTQSTQRQTTPGEIEEPDEDRASNLIGCLREAANALLHLSVSTSHKKEIEEIVDVLSRIIRTKAA